MAFLITPRFAPAYMAQRCSYPCAPAQPTYRRVVRSPYPSFAPFLGQVEELLSELDREARRQYAQEVHRQRQQRKRAFRAHFAVQETQDGYQIDGDVPGFEQDQFLIEITDAHTLRVVGDFEKKTVQSTSNSEQVLQHQEAGTTALNQSMEGFTLSEPEQVTQRAESPGQSDTASHKSYQATVEEDYEDLGAEASSTFSADSQTDDEPHEPKGKEKADEQVGAEAPVQGQTQLEAQRQAQQQSEQSAPEERLVSSFERTFRFPERIDGGNVNASLKNGLLSIIVPKAKTPEVRRILIQ